MVMFLHCQRKYCNINLEAIRVRDVFVKNTEFSAGNVYNLSSRVHKLRICAAIIRIHCKAI